MSTQLLACLACAGCSYGPLHALGGDGSGAPGDAAVDDANGSAGGDDSGDGSAGPLDCWAHWMDGTVAIDPASVKEITELTSAGVDRYPSISSDGLTMYFSRDLGPPNHGDVYVAKRNPATGMFDAGAQILNVDTVDEENRAWLTSDALTLVEATDHSSTQIEIHMDVRSPNSNFGTPTANHLSAVNSPGSEREDPWISDDGLHLYWAADTNGGKFQLLTATRAATADDFSTPSPVGGIPIAVPANFIGPALYRNERLILFGTYPQGTGTADLRYATRANSTGDFDAMAPIPTVDTSNDEVDPALSADGCDLYFASNQGHPVGSNLHIFHAKIVK